MHPESPRATIRTGYAPFDARTPVLSPCNFIGDTVASHHVRAGARLTGPAGTRHAPGELRDADLRFFEGLGLTPAIEREIRLALLERPGFLYAFFTHGGDPAGRRVHGFLLTEAAEGMYQPIKAWLTGAGPESAAIMAAVEPWLTYPPGTLDRAVAAAARLGARLAGPGDPEVDAVVAIAREAEDAMPSFGAWRVLTDVAAGDALAVPRLAHLAPRIAGLAAADRDAFARARGTVGVALDDLYRETFRGEYVQSPAAMRAVRELVERYPAPDPAPDPAPCP